MRNKDKGFRADIAGLRALAVMLVLLSHFGIPGFEFGFIGVDIFFVISGFLITRVLYKEYITSSKTDPTKSSLSLSGFYLRRIRRLLPAALTVIIAVNFISYFLSNPIARENLILNSRWALFFLANVAFLRSGTDYFQQNNEPSMLQHYWSLSVEEQFYFIWPILFLIAANLQKLRVRKISIRFNVRILVLIAGVSLLSFVFLQYGFTNSPVAAYFSIFTRAWELGIGSFFGILAFNKGPQRVYSKMEQYLPLFLCIFAISISISNDNWARLVLLPSLVTGFFLYAGQDRLIVDKESIKFLGILSKLTMYIGAISYSLYLVHWPIYIIASRFQLADTLVERLGLFPVSIFSAHLLWKYVEIPFQRIPLPKKSIWEEKVFHFLKNRRILIGTLTCAIVGSLYVVTYPAVTSNLLYSDSKLQKLVSDPVLKSFANYESQLTQSGNSQISTNDSNSSTSHSEDVVALTAEVVSGLEEGVKSSKLTSPEINAFGSIKKDRSPYESSSCNYQDTEVPQECSVGSTGTGAKKVALIGDSKMGHFAQPLIDYYTKKGWRIFPLSMDGCHMSDPGGSAMKNCAKRSQWALKNIESEKYDLVISAEWPGTLDYNYQHSYFSSIQKNAGKLIILQTNSKTKGPTECVNSDYTINTTCYTVPLEQQPGWLNGLNVIRALKSTNTFIVESQNWICVKAECPYTSNGTLVTRDGSHLTYSYIKKITPLIDATLDSLYTW